MWLPFLMSVFNQGLSLYSQPLSDNQIAAKTRPVFIICSQKPADFLHEVLVTVLFLPCFDVRLLQSALHRNKL